MQHRFLALLALGLLGAHLAAAGFLDKCGRLSGDEWVLSTDGNMGTYCNDDNCNSNEFTVFNLNECFSNKDGRLVHDPNPEKDFMESCRKCRVIGETLGCECRRSRENGGTWIDARVNVNKYIDTWNGYLRCNNRVSHCMKMSYRCKPKGWSPNRPNPQPTVSDRECNLDWPTNNDFFEEGEAEAIAATMMEQTSK